MSVKPGKYLHYKGNEYEVLYTATHSETLEKVVVYRPLYNDSGIWVRPLSMFKETVLINGVEIPRFKFTGV
jgi:cyclomaltodextrinase / maltogenic alpha-amylase / neopullulanase